MEVKANKTRNLDKQSSMQRLTLLTARKISKALLVAATLFAASGCTLFERTPDAGEQLAARASRQRIFFASYDEVWRAIHTALKYTIATENPDTGVIETEYIKGVDGWVAPGQKRSTSAGARYKVFITLAKGRTEGRESTRVTIEKRGEILKDFFSEPTQIASDGLEEAVLFYRIERELVITEALKRAGD